MQIFQIAVPVAVRPGAAEIALIVNKIEGDSFIDILKNPHIAALSQIVHIEMVQIFHVISERFLDTEIFGNHNPYIKILLVKAFRKRADYVRQTPCLDKRNRF